MAITITADKAAVKRKLTVTDLGNGNVEVKIEAGAEYLSLEIDPAERNAVCAFLLRVED
jgi:hypothetical protein